MPLPRRKSIALGPSARKAARRSTLDPLLGGPAQAETLAMKARKDAPEAPLNKSLLLSEKAKLTSNPRERQALLDEARRLSDLYLELKKLPPPGGER